ncbi:homologous recombination OB-fold protein isoform X1 [Erinaceus europaeus]|uniref:Homologous recombination OB-fold protein isoform X1 n=1 Tax=Erinaceus europaeus TaxID=9365 RepID=A0ABM3YE86_ERIEU|nr:homologous recombination OB-fold protein isoform X1 [Erinaceus europaeus]
MACSLQKLFAVEEEFEDEDFLSAVEDTENQFAGSHPVNSGCLRPVSSWPRDSVQAQSAGQLLSCPTAPSETLGQPAHGLHLPASSMPRTARGPPSTKTAPLRPISTSNNPARAILTELPQEPIKPPSIVCHPLLTFESQQQVSSGFEGPEQDEFDKILASMELEGPGMESDLGVSGETPGVLPVWQREDSVLAKKARVADLSRSCQKWPMPATHLVSISSAQGELPLGHFRTPPACGKPGTVSDVPVPNASAAPTQQQHWEACPAGPSLSAPQLPQAADRPVQSSPQNHFSDQSFQSPVNCLSRKPHFLGPQTPNSGSSTPSRTVHGSFPRRPLQPRAPLSSVQSPVGTPKGPHSSLAPQAALQTPVVTNHLVQLVTAASRTPQQPMRTSTPAKTRRFPGPAGVLPHQHSGKNLEEIMVSTPQTPTHGALAKFQTEIVTSSQASAEEDFGRGPWMTMKSALGLDERDPTCFLSTYSIVMVLRKAALKQLPRNKVPNMAVMIKSLTRSTMDASAVFKDPTGEMQGTVHRLLLETRLNELKPGSVLLLKQIGVFSPSLRNHYLNVTPNNLVHIYIPDCGDGNMPQPPQLFPKDPGNLHGSLQFDDTVKPGKDIRTAQNTETGAFPKEELTETDDLDGLLSELPEDFFCGTSTWDCAEAGHPP